MKLNLIVIGVALAVALTASSCKKKGPAEELGEKLDRAAEDVRDSIHKDGPAEKFGKSVDKLFEEEK